MLVEVNDGVVNRTRFFRTTTKHHRFDNHLKIGMACTVLAYFPYLFEFFAVVLEFLV